jgi:acyl-CoA-dependent ceramide synthase
MLLYLQLPSIFPDTVFGFFVFSWLVTRQGAFTLVVWSLIVESPIYIERDFRPMEGRFWSGPTYWAFVSLLLGLLILLWVWFWMICRVAFKVISGKPAEDVRSDEEE